MEAAPQVQLEQLRASLQVLDAQRALLGDAIEPALQAVRANNAFDVTLPPSWPIDPPAGVGP